MGFTWQFNNHHMKTETACRLLAEAIRRILEAGITLSTDVVDYIDATFFNPTVREIHTLLADDANCEKDSLIELLLFPDESMQISLETLLDHGHFRPADETTILSFLYVQPFQVCVHFPDERGSFDLEVPKPAAVQLLSRLNIAKQLSRKLRESINRQPDVTQRNRFKVRLRNSRFKPVQQKIDFLYDLFEKMDTQTEDFLDCLDFALDLLDEIIDDDIYHALMAKKKFYFQSLQKAEQRDFRLKQHNMETLLLQGMRMVIMAPADARKKMLMIDRISRAVFGHTEYFGVHESTAACGVIRSAENIDGIIRIFQSE